MPSLNKCLFIGNIIKDPEPRQYGGGKRMAIFSIAVTEKWNDKNGQKKENTEFVNITAFKSAEFILNYLKKGDKVYVECKYSLEDYNNKKYPKFTLLDIISISPHSGKNENNYNASQEMQMPF